MSLVYFKSLFVFQKIQLTDICCPIDCNYLFIILMNVMFIIIKK